MTFVDITSLFLSPRLYCSRTMRVYFAGAQGTISLLCSTRNKQLQRQNHTTSAGTSLLQLLFFFPLHSDDIIHIPKRCPYLSPPTQGFSSKPISSSPSSKEASIQRMSVLKKKILPLCSFFYTSFLLSGWRDLDSSKCQNPLSGWLSDQAPRWSEIPCQVFPHLANSIFEPSPEKLACPRRQLPLCPAERGRQRSVTSLFCQT